MLLRNTVYNMDECLSNCKKIEGCIYKNKNKISFATYI
ncbi:hypothetical protein BAQ_2292 [Bacillus anthracis str. A0193]|nr:Hypothetical Protein H9401_2134 [Bacillus anthracis str. H9401]EDR85389.1 hypothetical protein BAQ_2292 [Bacillus anthracis str. A0193]EDV17680.1 hypothetical protein BATI_2162 [Bacillus anthracis str. Tsiankovskii-I]